MRRQPGNAVALVGWGLGIKWVKKKYVILSAILILAVAEGKLFLPAQA